jgi:hypothetical protein
MGHRQGSTTVVTEAAVWQQVVHTDRIRALAATDPTDIRVQPVDAGCWRVVDAAAAWGDPDMLLGFIERTVDGFDCTLMAALHEHDRRASLQDARAWFEHRCGQHVDEAPC